ncbi:MAG: lipopolysaccharide biosynthesis protein [Terriglobales bacterium]
MSSGLSEYVERTEERARTSDVPVHSAASGFEHKDFQHKTLEHAYLLWAKRALLRNALLMGLAAGALIALLIPVRYESTVQLMPPDSPSNGGMAMLAAMAKSAGGMESMAGDVLGLKNPGSLFIGVLRSRTVEDRMIDRYQLKKIYGVRLNEDARRELAQNTGIGEDRKSGIITISVSDHDRGRARAMATAYVEELNRLVAEVSTSSAHRERVFLEERLAAVKQELDEASRALGEFSSQNATLDVQEQGRAMVTAAATLQGALIAAESQRRALEAIYTPNNARVRAAEAQAAELRQQLEKLGGGKTAGLESGNATDPDSIYPSLRKFPLLGVKYEELYRHAKIEEVVFEALTKEYETAKVEEVKETPTVKLLDDANLPERRSFPPRLMITILCGFATSLGTMAWVVARQRWERTDAGDPRKQFAQEVFHGMNSAMPWAPPNGSRWQAATHRVWIRFVNPGGEPAAETHD